MKELLKERMKQIDPQPTLLPSPLINGHWHESETADLIDH